MIAWVVDARAFKLVANLDDEQIMGPLLPKTNPLLWEIGHHAWFQFFWVLRPAAILGFAPRGEPSAGA